MLNKNLLKIAVIALTISVMVPISAQEMKSRVQTGVEAQQAGLRSNTAPEIEVRIAPSQRALMDAAESSMREDAIVSPITKTPDINKLPKPSIPKRVGAVFKNNNASITNRWEQLPDLSKVTHIKIVSVGARGIRAKLQLPPGLNGEMRVVANLGDTAEIIPLRLALNGEIYTPYTDGDTQIVEISTVDNIAGTEINVVDIAHFEESLNESKAGAPGLPSISMAAGSCSPDVVCSSNNFNIDSGIMDRSKSTVRLSYMSGSGAFVCSATLINSNVQQNFLLTANHCISTQAEANSVSTRWFYQASFCGGGTAAANPSSVTVSGGTELVFTNQFLDSTLLRMNNSPPVGAIFSGWNADVLMPDTSVVSISHPTGDVMKYALGTLSSTIQQRADGLIRLGEYEQEMYAVLFSRGIIEGGSSGSGLFTLNGNSLQLRGILSSSTVQFTSKGMTCTETRENANYGRFDYFYLQIAPILNGQSYPADDYSNQINIQAPAIVLGTTVNATLGYVGDIDVFRIPITETGTLFVRSQGGFDLIGNLMDSNGKTLTTNDDDFSGNNEFGITWKVNPGNYYIAVAAWNPNVVTNTGYSISTNFTTATTNYTSLWWGEQAESGWGVNVNHQGNIIFATMFNYEAGGLGTQNNGMWLTSTLNRINGTNSYTGTLLRITGPAFNASPFSPIGNANINRVGNMRFDFTSDNTGIITYDVAGFGTGGSGEIIAKNITKQTFGKLPTCSFSGGDRNSSNNFQDLWWNPNESGWGINFTHQGDIVFATLFTYQSGAGVLNKGMWLTGTLLRQAGTKIFKGDLLKVTGSAYNANPFIPLNPDTNINRVGNMQVEFVDGKTGKLIYDVFGQQVNKNIERQVFDIFKANCQ